MTDSPRPAYPFERAWSFAEKVKGWFAREEADLLYRLTGEACTHGRIVELGSFCGRSSIVIAASLVGVSHNPLVCVDTFRGSAEHQPGSPSFDPNTVVDGVVNTHPAFEKNLRQANLISHVEVVQLSTLEAAARFSEMIGLLFVDADHDYQAVTKDLEAWMPRMARDGVIVLHDVGAWGGPTRAAADLLEAGYRRNGQAGCALGLRKRT